MFLEYQSSMVHNQWVSKDHNKTPFIREIYWYFRYISGSAMAFIQLLKSNRTCVITTRLRQKDFPR
jgi:lipid-A-disaccharide synthase-like uncharacterized protein